MRSNNQFQIHPILSLTKPPSQKNSKAFLKERENQSPPLSHATRLRRLVEMCTDDQASNKQAINNGSRILSNYNLPTEGNKPQRLLSRVDKALPLVFCCLIYFNKTPKIHLMK